MLQLEEIQFLSYGFTFSYAKVFLCEISLVCCLKYPYSCFSFYFCFQCNCYFSCLYVVSAITGSCAFIICMGFYCKYKLHRWPRIMSTCQSRRSKLRFVSLSVKMPVSSIFVVSNEELARANTETRGLFIWRPTCDCQFQAYCFYYSWT